MYSITQPPVPLVSLKKKKTHTHKKSLSLHQRSNSWNSDSPGFPSCLSRMVSLTTLLELCRSSSVCGIDGIPWGRLGLVSLVRRSWTNTFPQAKQHVSGLSAALTHLCLQFQLPISQIFVPITLSFPPTSLNFTWRRAARLPRGQRRQRGAGCTQNSTSQTAVWGQLRGVL